MRLTPELAARLAALPLVCIPQEYPNKTGHLIEGPADARLSPRELHPAFYGCLDWHSSVHGHWLLVRLLKTGLLPDERPARAQLAASFTPEGLQGEADYFTRFAMARHWERAYGWAWLLQLDAELASWSDPDARHWHAALQPLTQRIAQLWAEWLPRQTYPTRSGIHSNSAFAQGLALDWARTVGANQFADALAHQALAFHASDAALPVHLEPGGADFLSPSLCVADLMARVLKPHEFERWWAALLPAGGVAQLARMPQISDLSDYQTVHLVGLALSRAWALRRVACALGGDAQLTQAADGLLAHGLSLVFEGDYGGDHWLATFAVYAMGAVPT